MQDMIQAIKSRRSVREFSARKIANADIEQIIDAARYAPTARGIQPWEFLAVTDTDKLKEIADITEHGKFIAQCACCIAVFCTDTKYYLEDGCAATENILLAAAGLGIGSCWVAGDKKEYCGRVAALLHVPADKKLVSLLALGYAANKEKAERSKRPLSDVLHWEKF